MSRDIAIKRLDQMLSSKKNLRCPEYISAEDIALLRDALLRLPEESLLELIEADPIFLFAKKEDLISVGMPQEAIGGFNAPRTYIEPHPFNGRYGFYISSDISKEEIEHVSSHEIGHALDYKAARSIGSNKAYLSDDNQAYKDAINAIIKQGKFKDIMTVSHGLGRTFQEHAGFSTYQEDKKTIYREFSAEAFAKYTSLHLMHGPAEADNILSQAYGDAWEIYKEDINPAISSHINEYKSKGVIHHRQASINIMQIEDRVEIASDHTSIKMDGMSEDEILQTKDALSSLGIEFELVGGMSESGTLSVKQGASREAISKIINEGTIIDPIERTSNLSP